MVLLLLCGGVSVVLGTGEIFVVPEILVVPEIFVVLAVDSRVLLGLLDPHGLAFFGPCLPARSKCWLLELG